MAAGHGGCPRAGGWHADHSLPHHQQHHVKDCAGVHPQRTPDAPDRCPTGELLLQLHERSLPGQLLHGGPIRRLRHGAFSILLPNFTYAATGLYECLHSNGSQRVVTQRWVSATLFRHNVFDPPMQNVTVRYGDPAAMVCGVRFNFLPGYLKTRFLWRSGGYLLMADSIPAVADQARSWWGFYGRFEFGIDDAGRCSSTMKINRVTWKDAGRYECWFRISDRLDEWIMQEAYLHVV
ncbi:uncharacterized protein LOC129601273 [Paramacrobiotus metropolitanus]|uniref:uncharacterized protein LOC129601273 n=1 Tax=Paramacrobiotus metropolitanus TaxID=2943436 RepID=UPI0024463FEF|nr:uncharacterized protein LOC129601273 [Paramacrobiotus metropolitanus]